MGGPEKEEFWHGEGATSASAQATRTGSACTSC
jgi:hypothetical protein